jgi:hypothetical protein
MGTATAAVGLGTGLQGRTLFQKHRHQRAIHLIAHVFPFHELAARQRDRLVGGNHLVEDGLKNLTEPFPSLLPIRQRCHGFLRE